MKRNEVASIIDEVITSLSQNPSQFNLINVGAIGIGGSGGSGITGIANGGGIGFQSTVSQTNFPNRNTNADLLASQSSVIDEDILNILSNLKNEILSEEPSKSFINSIIQSISENLPDVIIKSIIKLIELCEF
jgi:hypothetical protein